MTARRSGRIRLRVLGLGVDPGAPGSYTGPYMLGSGSYHVRNKQKKALGTPAYEPSKYSEVSRKCYRSLVYRRTEMSTTLQHCGTVACHVSPYHVLGTVPGPGGV